MGTFTGHKKHVTKLGCKKGSKVACCNFLVKFCEIPDMVSGKSGKMSLVSVLLHKKRLWVFQNKTVGTSQYKNDRKTHRFKTPVMTRSELI